MISKKRHPVRKRFEQYRTPHTQRIGDDIGPEKAEA